MDAPKYVPARVKSFLSELYVNHYGDLNAKMTMQCQRERYEHSLPINPNPFFEQILELGRISDEERGLIESVWLDGDVPIKIPESALEIFRKLAWSSRIHGKLNSII